MSILPNNPPSGRKRNRFNVKKKRSVFYDDSNIYRILSSIHENHFDMTWRQKWNKRWCFHVFLLPCYGSIKESLLIHILILVQNNLKTRFVVMEPCSSSLCFYNLQLKMISLGMISNSKTLSINYEQDLIEVLVHHKFLKAF